MDVLSAEALALLDKMTRLSLAEVRGLLDKWKTDESSICAICSILGDNDFKATCYGLIVDVTEAVAILRGLYINAEIPGSELAIPLTNSEFYYADAKTAPAAVQRFGDSGLIRISQNSSLILIHLRGGEDRPGPRRLPKEHQPLDIDGKDIRPAGGKVQIKNPR
ncbi:MAG: hypothetical protein ACREDR_00550 [Blastocatellia bacterium]